MEPEAVAGDRPAPPRINRPALSIREKAEASSAARRSHMEELERGMARGIPPPLSRRYPEQ